MGSEAREEMEERFGESGVPSLRSLAPTLPAPDEPKEGEDEQGDSEPARPASTRIPLVRRRRRQRRIDWCVDHGTSIATLSTFELWVAVASGEVRASTRVWREGMECWTRLEYIPELSCALRDMPAPPAPVVQAAPEDVVSTEAVLTDPSPAPEVDLGVDDELEHLLTEPRATDRLPALDETPAPVVALRPREVWSPRWLATGIAAAVVAVAAASFAGGQRPSIGSHAARRTGPIWAAATATLVAPDPAPPSGRRSPVVDPGQQRRRTGTSQPGR